MCWITFLIQSLCFLLFFVYSCDKVLLQTQFENSNFNLKESLFWFNKVLTYQCIDILTIKKILSVSTKSVKSKKKSICMKFIYIYIKNAFFFRFKYFADCCINAFTYIFLLISIFYYFLNIKQNKLGNNFYCDFSRPKINNYLILQKKNFILYKLTHNKALNAEMKLS